MALIIFSVADTRWLVTMMTFVLVEIAFTVDVITCSLAKIILVVSEITFNVAVITCSVVKIPLVLV